MGRPKDQDISTPLSQCVGQDISCAFRAGRPTGWAQDISSPLHNMSAKIYHVPSEQGQTIDWGTGYIHPTFRTGRPGYIYPPSQRVGRYISIPLPSGSAEIYHMPSEWVRRDIFTPLPSRSAEIYPYPFPVGRPRYIICLQNGSAGIYPPPFPVGWPTYIHTPSQQVG